MRNLSLLLLAFVAPVLAHDTISTKLTWSRDVSRIVWKRCGGCHQEGRPAPMSLLTYEEARPWAKAIKEEILERRMPPWGAVKGFGDFQNDWGLTQEEITVIADWVEGGAPAGDPNLLPFGKPSALPVSRPGRIFGKVRNELKLDRRIACAHSGRKAMLPRPSLPPSCRMDDWSRSSGFAGIDPSGPMPSSFENRLLCRPEAFSA